MSSGRKKGHEGHHGGAWKVAYADFVTAMMALFIVLWLMTSDEKVRKAVGGYFADPAGIGKQVGTTMAGAGNGVTLSKDNMDSLKNKIEQAIHELPKFEQLNRQIKVIVTNDGLRIELLETEKGMFFESGKAQPTESGKCCSRCWRIRSASSQTKFSLKGTPTPNLTAGRAVTRTGSYPPIAPTPPAGS